MTKPDIRILLDSTTLARAAAVEFVELAKTSVNERGVFHIALSGGSTPKAMFALLVSEGAFRDRMPWDKTHFWWSDERHVPPDNSDSNFRMANDAMLSRAPVPPGHIHRIRGEYADASQAAEEYETEIRTVLETDAPEIPQLDLILLGMGPDGHTASLFPGTTALQVSDRLVVANWVGKFYTWRISFTAPLINRARCVMFLVAGNDKASALKGVMEGPIEPAQLPAQLIQPTSGNLIWLLDAGAAALLSATTLDELSEKDQNL